MISKHKVGFLVLIGGMMATAAPAQSGTGWLENTMFESGKINVVVAVVAVVFVLITLYLISLDRKLKKLEQSEKKESK